MVSGTYIARPNNCNQRSAYRFSVRSAWGFSTAVRPPLGQTVCVSSDSLHARLRAPRSRRGWWWRDPAARSDGVFLKQKVFTRICASRSVLTALTGTASHTKVSKAETEKLKSLFKEHKSSLSLDDSSKCCTCVKNGGLRRPRPRDVDGCLGQLDCGEGCGCI